MKQHLALRCRCGAAGGKLAFAPGSALHLICYCDDCRAFAQAIERADILDADGGTEVVIVPFACFNLETGMEHVRCLRLSEKGMFRWYWGCCNTPIANTQPSPMAPAVSVHGACIVEANKLSLEPITRVMARHATGNPPPDAEQGIAFPTLLKILWFMLKNFVRGAGKPNVLHPHGQILTAPRVLTPVERKALC